MDVRTLLTQRDRRWNSAPGASEQQIARLVASSPVPMPDAFLEFFRFSNGGEGDLALPPLIFVLDDVDTVIGGLHDPFLAENFPGFLFFGGNGGLERIALDLRGGNPPWPIVMIDPIAGPSSAEQIAPDMRTFLHAVGLESRT